MAHPFLRRRTILAAAAAAIGLGGATGAFAQPELVDLKVVDRDTGQTLQVWRHHGRLFVAGDPGRRYALRVTNRSNGRVLVVMSVDGVNILSGDTADYDQDGYVFDPHESYDLTGWRKTDTEVAQFVFAPLPQSYAARTGRPADVGVIGIAAFREKPAPPPPPVVSENRDSGSIYGATDIPSPARAQPSFAEAPPPPPPPSPQFAANDAKAAAPADRSSEVTVTGSRIPHPGITSTSPVTEKLGTGHGAREWSVTYTVPFERATDYPETIQQIEYDTYDNLVAHGVIRAPDRTRHPRPFPTRPDGEGYVPDPPPEL